MLKKDRADSSHRKLKDSSLCLFAFIPSFKQTAPL